MFSMLVECLIAVLAITAAALYARAVNHKKSTMIYGIMLDLSGIHLIAFPVLHAAFTCFRNNAELTESIILLISVLIYILVLGLDIRYLIGAYQKNKAMSYQRRKEKKR